LVRQNNTLPIFWETRYGKRKGEVVERKTKGEGKGIIYGESKVKGTNNIHQYFEIIRINQFWMFRTRTRRKRGREG